MNSKNFEPQESIHDACGILSDRTVSGSELDRRDFLRQMGKSLAVVASVPLLETMMGKAGAAFAAEPAGKPRVSKSGLPMCTHSCGILKHRPSTCSRTPVSGLQWTFGDLS